jgi:death-on-curing protein
VNFLFPTQALYLHKRITEAIGGASAVRDHGLLESAVYRPMAAFGGVDLYPDLFTKAAALGHSLINNHPFVDGNKRTGYEAMRLTLRLNEHDIRASEDEAYRFVMGMAEGKIDEHAAAAWLKTHAVKRR